MNYGTIKIADIADGPGCRVSIFVSGCRNHCKGCFQPETWDFEFGTKFTRSTVTEILHKLEPSYIQGLSVLGGDPFEPENQVYINILLNEVRLKYGNTKDIWIYTGYVYGENIPHTTWTDDILKKTDVLVDGPFVESLKDITLTFRGSSNQRLLYLQDGIVIKEATDE